MDLPFKEKKAMICQVLDSHSEIEKGLSKCEMKMKESILKAQRFMFAHRMHTDTKYRERFLKEQAEGLQPSESVSIDQALINRENNLKKT